MTIVRPCVFTSAGQCSDESFLRPNFIPYSHFSDMQVYGNTLEALKKWRNGRFEAKDKQKKMTLGLITGLHLNRPMSWKITLFTVGLFYWVAVFCFWSDFFFHPSIMQQLLIFTLNNSLKVFFLKKNNQTNKAVHLWPNTIN